jgi:hypothetical protein
MNRDNIIIFVMGLIMFGLFLLAMLHPRVADAACLSLTNLPLFAYLV